MGKRKLLIVEDDMIVANYLKMKLIDLGYEISGFAMSGEDACALAARERPDLVLMDVRLSGKMDGIETARQIYGQLQIPILFVSAYLNKESFARISFDGVIGFASKPIDEDELHYIIHNFFDTV